MRDWFQRIKRQSMWIMICSLALLTSLEAQSERDVEMLLVVGASGTPEYGKHFEKQVGLWKEACSKGSVPLTIIGQGESEKDLENLEKSLKAAVAKKTGQFWLVLIGHGTFDGRETKFNLRGPDISSEKLGEWLKPIKREFIFIQNGSASAGFIQPLKGENRILVTATKSADEIFYTRFGEYFAPAIGGLTEADLDQDKQVSILEAFLYAGKKTAEFYEKEERLATEHALIDDNGDGVGTRYEVFEGIQATVDKADGVRAAQVALVLSDEDQQLSDAQRKTRDTLETEIKTLTQKRKELGDDAYYTQLETLLRHLSEVYREIPNSPVQE